MQLGLLLHLLPLTSCHGLAAAHRLRGGAAITLPPLVGAYQWSALAAAPITTNVLSAASLPVRRRAASNLSSSSCMRTQSYPVRGRWRHISADEKAEPAKATREARKFTRRPCHATLLPAHAKASASAVSGLCCGHRCEYLSLRCGGSS